MIAVACLVLVAAAAARCAVTFVHGFLGLMAALVIVLAAGGVLRWFAFPGRRLPRNRVRMMRLRLRLGLRPGPGHATGVECWWRWGRFAAFRRSRRARRSLLAWRRYWRPSEHAFLVGRAYRLHRLWVPSEEHALVMAPPRTRKTGWLAKVILHWPARWWPPAPRPTCSH
jgi:type IV secretion system protein VirD4